MPTTDCSSLQPRGNVRISPPASHGPHIQEIDESDDSEGGFVDYNHESQRIANISDHAVKPALAETDSEYDDDDYVHDYMQTANIALHESSSEDESSSQQSAADAAEMESQLPQKDDITYINIGSCGEMPDDYIEDPSEFEQEHETARAFALRGVFTGCTGAW